MGMSDTLDKHIHYLTHLNRDRKNGGAPHKPILLLAVINLIEKSEINTYRIVISPELVLEFKDIWSRLVETQHNVNFALPFFHMRSEPFWKLVAKPGFEIPVTSSKSIKSFRALKESLAYAEISQELFLLLNDEVCREIVRRELHEAYFPNSYQNHNMVGYGYRSELIRQLFNENKAKYKSRIEELRQLLSADNFEEEAFVRSAVFKREIPRLYNYQCAVSGLRIESTINAQMVDACHIEPFSVNGDDTVRNGICLTPTIHRAFDRGLLTIDSDYCVCISRAIVESDSPFSLLQFDRKPILLPESPTYYPSLDNLSYHQKEIFVS